MFAARGRAAGPPVCSPTADDVMPLVCEAIMDEDGFAPPTGIVPPCTTPATGAKPGAVIARGGLDDVSIYDDKCERDSRVCSLALLFDLFKEKEEFIWHVPFRFLGLSLEEL